ncbi:TPA: hypothetical protein I7730_16200 [Vibrio vulnificus]|uniref:Uncharacterized protein n=1 Tax=Vibrio vulnificus TaxID=672 RepID=A0A8H9N1X4_VIBVL|nr:hypothetical protein [Vibrio vulnificus]
MSEEQEIQTYIHPLDQLFLLNRELAEIINDIDEPVIVVGGQAIAYWNARFQDYMPNDENSIRAGQSTDIDYIARLQDIETIVNKWGAIVAIATNHPPPQLALSTLRDSCGKIKEHDGAKFLNIDDYLQDRVERANIVDFIDAPRGFDLREFRDRGKLLLTTTEFDLSLVYEDFGLSDKLRILTPISCIKSRLSNLFGGIKEPRLEVDRIKLLRVIVSIYFIELLSSGEKERYIKKQLDYFAEVVGSTEGAKLNALYSVDLRDVFEYVATDLNLFNGKYIEKQYPYVRSHFDHTYEVALNRN